MARRIMFIIDIENEGNRRKWKDLLEEHPDWKHHYDQYGDHNSRDTVQVIIPNLTFDCAETIDGWLKEKGIERTWLKDDEPDYYRILAKYGWPC